MWQATISSCDIFLCSTGHFCCCLYSSLGSGFLQCFNSQWHVAISHAWKSRTQLLSLNFFTTLLIPLLVSLYLCSFSSPLISEQLLNNQCHHLAESLPFSGGCRLALGCTRYTSSCFPFTSCHGHLILLKISEAQGGA